METLALLRLLVHCCLSPRSFEVSHPVAPLSQAANPPILSTHTSTVMLLLVPVAADLIALLTLYNAAFAVLGVWLIDGGLPNMQDMPNISLFSKAVVATACMGLTAAVLYQRALSIAPLSLTVPYLAFAPVFVVSLTTEHWAQRLLLHRVWLTPYGLPCLLPSRAGLLLYHVCWVIAAIYIVLHPG